MDTNTAKALALELMTKHNLHDWKFGFDRACRRAGLCSFRRKRITLSIYYVRMNSENEIRDTILHEIAHAITPTDAYHGMTWKLTAQSIGARPERCSARTVIMPKGRIVGACACGQEHSMFRMPKVLYFCTRCRKLVTWAESA